MIIVTGGTGFVGSHLVEELKRQEYEVFVPSRSDYNLELEGDCQKLMIKYKNVDCIVNLAALVGGIGFNMNHPYELLYKNLAINTNLIHWSIKTGVKKYVNISTTCAYPKFCPVPFNETAMWDGYPEETNAPYGLAKRMSIAQLQAAYKEYGFNGVTLIPTNMYGPRDNFNPNQSHVIPALIKKMFDAIDNNEDTVTVWGSGKATRDFIYVSDVVESIIKGIEKHNNPLMPLNVGSGDETSISLLVHYIQKATEFEGKIKWDNTKPDGQPRRRLNINEIKNTLAWSPKISLVDGLQKTVDWYKGVRYA